MHDGFSGDIVLDYDGNIDVGYRQGEDVLMSAPVAHRSEQGPYKALVAGSTPAGGTQ